MSKRMPTGRKDEGESADAFERFRDFTRKLAQVPKEEVDRLAEEEKVKKPDSSKPKA